MSMQFLAGFSPEQFLSEYWEKKILHIPNAVKIPSEAISQDDILEMINDEYFESRLICEDQNKITVKHAPLNIKSFDSLPSKWLMMIHNLNLYNEFALSLEKTVEFIPKWLFDDVMLSYSSKDSTINAHIDKYNVFILQVSGKRIWKLQHNPDPTYQADVDIRILKNFEPDMEFTLNPGDMLFIPPGVAHEGYSVEESMSVSIGFKSLDDQSMMENFLTAQLEKCESEEFFKAMLTKNSQSDPFLVSTDVLNSIRERVILKLTDQTQFNRWLNQYLSIPKVSETPLDGPMSNNEFSSLMKNHEFSLDEHVRMNAYADNGNYRVHINQIEFDLTPLKYAEIKKLISHKHLEQKATNYPNLKDELYILYKNGLLNLLE